MTESASNDNLPRRSEDEAEPDVYELNLDDSSDASANDAASASASAHGSPDAAKTPADSDDDIYDLAEPEPAPEHRARSDGSLKKVAKADPRFDTAAVPAPASDTAPDSSLEAADKPIPKQYQSQPDPAYVDPAVAASRREQARIRAAEQLAIEDAKRQKIKLIVLAVVVILALLIGGWLALT